MQDDSLALHPLLQHVNTFASVSNDFNTELTSDFIASRNFHHIAPEAPAILPLRSSVYLRKSLMMICTVGSFEISAESRRLVNTTIEVIQALR